MSDFIPGLELSRLFYFEAVKPILYETTPSLRYAAALIGSGSEVLGFDTEMSTDHHWGPRVMIFLEQEDHQLHSKAIDENLRNSLPTEFHGYPTNFTQPDPADNNVQLLRKTDCGPINHRVDLLTIRGFFLDYLNFDIEQSIETTDWLTFPEQKLLTVTAGAVYYDEVGLEAVRARFGYYPHDVWLYLLASGWTRVGQEEHLMGRSGIVNDEIGSAIIGSRLVRDLMRLCFLMERRYAPYPKWFGKAFSNLTCSDDLTPILRRVLQAGSWQDRERHLVAAYKHVAAMHNRLGITKPLPEIVSNFFERPFRVMHPDRSFVDALCASITDPLVKKVAVKSLIGSIDQFSDSTDLLSDPHWRTSLKRLYE